MLDRQQRIEDSKTWDSNRLRLELWEAWNRYEDARDTCERLKKAEAKVDDEAVIARKRTEAAEARAEAAGERAKAAEARAEAAERSTELEIQRLKLARAKVELERASLPRP